MPTSPSDAAAVSPASVGASLRELRLARGLSVEELARATRIGRAYLDALEGDRFAELPAPVFVKGFIRGCCAELGVPADEPLRRYAALIGEAPTAERGPARPRRAFEPSPLWISLILVAILGGGLAALTQLGRTQREPAERLDRPPAEAQAPVARPAPDRPTASVVPAPAPEAPPARAPAVTKQPDAPVSTGVKSGPLKLTVRAVEQTWVRLQTEEGRVVSELLEPGAVREWVSERRFVITVGNAAGIELTLNGQPIPPLGGRGEVVRRVEIPGPGAAEASTRR